MRNEKLIQLAFYLEKVDPYQFNMASWKRVSDCGTTCCAFGYAPNIFPELKFHDLQYRNNASYYGVWWADRPLPQSHEYDTVNTTWLCIQEFFGISEEDAYYLFDPLRYVDLSLPTVIDRIRKFALG